MDPSVWYYKCGVEELESLDTVFHRDIIDAGAYVGDSSVVLAQYTEKDVFAFEASNNNYRKIMEVCRLNNVRNVVPVNKGLSNMAGEERLYITQSGIGDGLVRRSAINYTGEETVKTVSIDEYVEEHGIDVGLIKADIEGGELNMLKGAKRTIDEAKPCLLISIYHTADDFFGIKRYLEETHPFFKFRVFQPYVRDRVIRDTMLVCEPCGL